MIARIYGTVVIALWCLAIGMSIALAGCSDCMVQAAHPPAECVNGR